LQNGSLQPLTDPRRCRSGSRTSGANRESPNHDFGISRWRGSVVLTHRFHLTGRQNVGRIHWRAIRSRSELADLIGLGIPGDWLATNPQACKKASGRRTASASPQVPSASWPDRQAHGGCNRWPLKRCRRPGFFYGWSDSNLVGVWSWPGEGIRRPSRRSQPQFQARDAREVAERKAVRVRLRDSGCSYGRSAQAGRFSYFSQSHQIRYGKTILGDRQRLSRQGFQLIDGPTASAGAARGPSPTRGGRPLSLGQVISRAVSRDAAIFAAGTIAAHQTASGRHPLHWR
jgi:hypothetical protein